MKRKIFMSLLTIAMVTALVGGATFAVFTDATTNTNNTFAAGTVDVSAGTDTISAGDVGNMAPGDEIPGSFTVTNEGTLDMYFRVVPATDGALFGGANPAEVVLENYEDWTELVSDGEVTVNYTVTLPLAAGNEYQEAGGSLSFTVEAIQSDNLTVDELDNYDITPRDVY